MPAILSTKRTLPGAAVDGWAPGPLRPRLGDGAVHVWLADLTRVSDDLSEVLSPEEHARAERFLDARAGVLWARAHVVLRILLGRYLEADPRGLRFATGENGKPAVLDDLDRPHDSAEPVTLRPGRPSFNLSHSAHFALYGFTDAGPIGVDIEFVRRPINAVAVAARALGPAEAQRLGRLDAAVREREFLRAWTRHEAELKCGGTGLGGGAGMADGDTWIGELDVGPQGAGAVAIKKAAREMCSWEV